VSSSIFVLSNRFFLLERLTDLLRALVSLSSSSSFELLEPLPLVALSVELIFNVSNFASTSRFARARPPPSRFLRDFVR
jgi:hypothetical protein